jgi:hypothetical protein
VGPNHAQELWARAEESDPFNWMIMTKIDVIADFHVGRPENGE